MTRILESIARFCDRINDGVGHVLAWLLLVMALLTAGVALLRYGFDLGSIAVQEAYIWMHGTALMLGMGYCLKQDGHVRIDILYGRLGPRYRALVNVLGGILFLWPTLVVLGWFLVPYVVRSWERGEASRHAGGLEGLYLLKSVMLVYLVLLGLQSLSLVLRNAVRLAAPALKQMDRAELRRHRDPIMGPIDRDQL